MEQNRKRDTDISARSSKTEPAAGSRETVREGGKDLGTSSDRAMFSDRGSSNSDGITNRPLDRADSEEEQLPERARPKSDPVMPADDATLKTKI